MAHQHLKSACCRALVIRYGGKRRQCIKCRTTWTVRPKKRGRKPAKPPRGLIESYFVHDTPNVRSLARRLGCGRDRAQRLLMKSLVRHVSMHSSDWSKKIPRRGTLIVVADAIWHWLKDKKITIYILLLRPRKDAAALLCPPFFAFGHETAGGWRDALRSLPNQMLARIRGLVCDGHVALVAMGKRRHWKVQRCHFHLLANLQMYLGPRQHPRTIAILSLVRQLITTIDEPLITRTLARIGVLKSHSNSRGIRRVLSGLETNYRDFQTYLRYPKLNLPTTSNSAESCINGVRDLMRRCRGFRSLRALRLWVNGYMMWKKTIRCSGKHQQKKSV